MTAPEVLASGLHHKQNVFQTFLDGGKVKKRVFPSFTRFLTVIMASHTFFNPPSPINSLHFLKIVTPSSFSSSLLQRYVSIVGLS